MTVEASALREFHRLHRQRSDLQGRLDRGPRQIKAGESNIERFENALNEAKQALIQSRMTLDGKSLSLKEREARILDVRARLNSASSNKEYQAFMEQIAADEQANSVLSDEIIELLDRVSGDESVVKEAQANLEKGKQDLQSVTQRVATEQGDLQSELQRIRDELTKAEHALPHDVREQYQRVSKGYGEESLAEVEGEVCGGCYQRITPQMINELKLSKSVFCKSCGRILYLPEEDQA